MLIRWLTPLAWRTGDARLARAIRRFADVEADSGWQALQLLHAVDVPALKAEFFAIALEESAHARMFRQVALGIDRDIEQAWQSPGREALYSKRTGMIPAVADLMVSEEGVYGEFADYARATHHPQLVATFARIRDDEAGHGESAGEMLMRLSSGRADPRRALRHARWRRFGRNYMAGSKAIGGTVMGLLLRIAFYALGGFGRVFSGRAPAPPEQAGGSADPRTLRG
ncbi:MAG: ferritin-like domain-containing protein, partial [Xanthomonadales bacterium]|nr:ferritin-like domain-containing protein [Xanthomonadales bacterium]